MDKYESRLRIEEIEKLKKKKQYKEAARLADTIEWYRIKNAVTLYKVADLYKIVRDYTKCRDLLELAYDRSPYAKNVVFSLCEVCLEFGDFEAATEHYKEYVALAPDDAGVWVLKYKMLNALEAGIDERIEILETLKKMQHSEEWQYELATLYHRAGLTEKCVEECDDIITWFGDGSYVYKAMELKMLHEPLTPEQQAVYEGRAERKKASEEKRATGRMPKGEEKRDRHGERRSDRRADRRGDRRSERYGDTGPMKKKKRIQQEEEGDDEFHVKTINMGQFNTIDLQAELAENIQDYIGGEPSMVNRVELNNRIDSAPIPISNEAYESGILPNQEEAYSDSDENNASDSYTNEALNGYSGNISEIYATGEDTTDSLLKIVSDAEAAAAEEAARTEAAAAEQATAGSSSQDINTDTDSLHAQEVEFVQENRNEVFHNTIPADAKEVFFEDRTEDLRFIVNRPRKPVNDESKLQAFKENYSKEMEGKALPESFGKLSGEEENPDLDLEKGEVISETVPIAGGIVEEKVLEDGTVELIKHFEEDVEPEVVIVGQDRNRRMTKERPQQAPKAAPAVPREIKREEIDPDYVDMLPTTEESQISGQLNIQDILAGWEETKKKKEREFQESMRKKTLENTGNLFAEFDKEANSGLLATLENPALINSVTDQSTSEDFFKGLSVEDVKNGKQFVRNTGEIRVGKVIEAPVEEEFTEEEEPEKEEDENSFYDVNELLREKPVVVRRKSEDLETISMSFEKKEDDSEPETEEEENISTADNQETEEAPVQEEKESEVDPEEEMIQKLLDEDEKEAKAKEEENRDKYFGAVTQNISGNIWDEVDSVPVKETYSDPEPEEVNATKFMPARDEIDATAENFEEESEEKEVEVVKVSLTDEKEAEDAEAEDNTEEVKEEPKEPVEGATKRMPAIHKKSKKSKQNRKEDDGYQMAPLSDPEAENIEEPEEKEEPESEGGEDEESAGNGVGRDFSKDEKKYFEQFLYSKLMKKQILDAIETMTLAAYTGNLIITADSTESSSDLATCFYKYIKGTDANFTGKAARIGAEKLNKKNMDEIFETLANGALIVSHAGKMTNSTINGILQNLNQEARGVEVILHDSKSEIRRLLERAPVLEKFFNCRVDIIAMSPEMLAEYGKKYALGLGYAIDNMAMLAFSGRISELQIGTHLVSVDEVKQIVNDAIDHVNKPGFEKTWRTMNGTRYDEEHRVILREKDFEFRK